ncbi:hypothetical protein EKG83_10440 [Saccharothrix syringae]|uniref:Uncharacterized protein n=1 Tax=Saccharothrix syringae TaxID=103733 RepID=A0A5Q0GWF4_SACSY|nr:hypothetical protein EKG83_10440 [Saccharothrix syringae]
MGGSRLVSRATTSRPQQQQEDAAGGDGQARGDEPRRPAAPRAHAAVEPGRQRGRARPVEREGGQRAPRRAHQAREDEQLPRHHAFLLLISRPSPRKPLGSRGDDGVSRPRFSGSPRPPTTPRPPPRGAGRAGAPAGHG